MAHTNMMMQVLANLVPLCLMIGLKDVLCSVEEHVDIIFESACGNKYPYGSFTLSYDGQYFDGDSCKIQFTNSDVSKVAICIRPKTLNLDCGTKIQYQKYFVAPNTHDGELTCDKNNATYYDETCFPDVSEIFIIIKKNNQYLRNLESAKIDLYVKKSKSSVRVTLVVVGGVLTLAIGVLITTVIGIAVCVQKQRRQLKQANTTVSYTAATSSTTASLPDTVSQLPPSYDSIFPNV